MTKENIISNTYPYTTEVYAAVRSDIDRNSTAYKLFEFLTTAEGQNIVNESGYVPLDKASSVRSIYGANDITLSTIYTDLQEMNKAFVDIVVRNYDSPMGVATYKTKQDMPEELQKALPDLDKMKDLYCKSL